MVSCVHLCVTYVCTLQEAAGELVSAGILNNTWRKYAAGMLGKPRLANNESFKAMYRELAPAIPWKPSQ